MLLPLIITPTGRVCESNDLVGSSTRCVILPCLGRNLCRLHAVAMERCVLQDCHPRPQWTHIRRSVFTGGRCDLYDVFVFVLTGYPHRAGAGEGAGAEQGMGRGADASSGKDVSIDLLIQ